MHVSLNADHKFFYIVADSGIGIAEDEVEHIFERFYRVDKSHSREIQLERAWACYSKKCSCNASGRDQSVQSAG